MLNKLAQAPPPSGAGLKNCQKHLENRVIKNIFAISFNGFVDYPSKAFQPQLECLFCWRRLRPPSIS